MGDGAALVPAEAAAPDSALGCARAAAGTSATSSAAAAARRSAGSGLMGDASTYGDAPARGCPTGRRVSSGTDQNVTPRTMGSMLVRVPSVNTDT
jgi:hypothetical protein